jgi:hypothetical protein
LHAQLWRLENARLSKLRLIQEVPLDSPGLIAQALTALGQVLDTARADGAKAVDLIVESAWLPGRCPGVC